MRRILVVCFLVGAAALTLGGENFRFRQVPGDRYRILSQVREEVYVNGFLSHSAEILNRISLSIGNESEDGAHLEAEFQVSERAAGSGEIYQWGREYSSQFQRDSRGRYTIAPEFFMPVLRDIPVFPEGEVEIGESWNHPAWEVHDFRDNFGVRLPYAFPINVNYLYLGPEEREGLFLHAIQIQYTLFHRSDPPIGASPRYPLRISGISKQILYWNSEAGRPEYSQEEFNIFFDLASGDTVEFRGTAEGRVVEAILMNRAAAADNLRKSLENRGLEETDVQVSDRGVTITLRNIQFTPDSSFLLEGEKKKLDEIGEILKTMPGRDVEISGHTALRGTAEGRHRLSLERARAVGKYLLESGSREEDEIIIRGFGAQRPVADNETPEGRTLNRRVEITILEN